MSETTDITIDSFFTYHAQNQNGATWAFVYGKYGHCSTCGGRAHATMNEKDRCRHECIEFFGSENAAAEACVEGERRYFGKLTDRTAIKPPLSKLEKGLSWEELQHMMEDRPKMNIRPKTQGEWDEDIKGAISAPQPWPTIQTAHITEAARGALSFLSGLNLQDHSKRKQQKQLEVVRTLMQALNPTKAGR